VYLLEAGVVVGAASVLGGCVGFGLSLTNTALFYMVVELKFTAYVPWVHLGTLMCVTVAVTYAAVIGPVNTVNNRSIANTLKGN